MSAKEIPVETLFATWRNEPGYQEALDTLDSEFALASAIIAARRHAGLTQAELAERMGTTQSTIARLEGGKSKPSTTTLEKIASATGTELTIGFRPIPTNSP